ncbi:MAG: replicative DNA helicase [Bacteroidales bacterium]|nr:replicative DNA helicase [Bacteroidales bacterium]
MDKKLTPQQDNTRKRVRKAPEATSILDQGRVPPQAVDLEEAVLGAVMLEKDALTAVIDILKPEVFYKEAHRVIYDAIVALFNKSQPVDILTVISQLKSSGELDLIGGAYYISQLTNRVASSANVEYHARIILQKFIQRELIRVSSEIIKDAFEDTTDVFDLLDRAEQNLFAVSEQNIRRQQGEIHKLMQEAIKDIETARDSETKLRGVPSGFVELDRITNGFQKADLIILASRPGMGKTALALTLARNMAVDHKKPIAFFSLEMSSVQLVTRLIAAETQLNSDKLRKGDLQDFEWQQLNTKIRALEDAKIFIDDTPGLSIFELRAKCRRLKAQNDVQMIFVDYLQLMVGTQDNKGNREQEISQISRSLKALAKELDIPIMAMSQLSRAVETRAGDKKPILSDLRESGAIEQDADIVLFIYRPEYYGLTEDENQNSLVGLATISISKHRNGATGELQLRFIKDFAKYAELDTIGGFDQQLSADGGDTFTVPSKMNDLDDDVVPF